MLSVASKPNASHSSSNINQLKPQRSDSLTTTKTQTIAQTALPLHDAKEFPQGLKQSVREFPTKKEIKNEVKNIKYNYLNEKDKEDFDLSLKQTFVALNGFLASVELSNKEYHIRNKDMGIKKDTDKNIIEKNDLIRNDLIAIYQTHSQAYNEMVERAEACKVIIQKELNERELEREFMRSIGVGISSIQLKMNNFFVNTKDRHGILYRLAESERALDFIANKFNLIGAKADDKEQAEVNTRIQEASPTQPKNPMLLDNLTQHEYDIRKLSRDIVAFKEDVLTHLYAFRKLVNPSKDLIQQYYLGDLRRLNGAKNKIEKLNPKNVEFKKEALSSLGYESKKEGEVRWKKIAERFTQLTNLLYEMKTTFGLHDDESKIEVQKKLSDEYITIRADFSEIVALKEDIVMAPEWLKKAKSPALRLCYFTLQKRFDLIKEKKQKILDSEESIYNKRMDKLDLMIQKHTRDLETLSLRLADMHETKSKTTKEMDKLSKWKVVEDKIEVTQQNPSEEKANEVDNQIEEKKSLFSRFFSSK